MTVTTANHQSLVDEQSKAAAELRTQELEISLKSLRTRHRDGQLLLLCTSYFSMQANEQHANLLASGGVKQALPQSTSDNPSLLSHSKFLITMSDYLHQMPMKLVLPKHMSYMLDLSVLLGEELTDA